jgi:hypothetical protein
MTINIRGAVNNHDSTSITIRMDSSETSKNIVINNDASPLNRCYSEAVDDSRFTTILAIALKVSILEVISMRSDYHETQMIDENKSLLVLACSLNLS